MSNRGLLTLEQLWVKVEANRIDTVPIVITDMQGRLQGKRLSARFFLAEVATHGSEACNYLLAVDVDMSTVDGYAMSSWERGYGDFVMRPDMSTLRAMPWHAGSARCATPARTGATATWPARRSARRSSRTTPTTRASSWTRSSAPSPTGSCSAASSASDRAGPERT